MMAADQHGLGYYGMITNRAMDGHHVRKYAVDSIYWFCTVFFGLNLDSESVATLFSEKNGGILSAEHSIWWIESALVLWLSICCEFEVNSKWTGSSQHILGFSTKKKPIHQAVAISAGPKQKTAAWGKVFHSSSNIVTFIDLAGHEKYLKTTISGLTGCFPDYAFIVVGANMGISKMTREHIQVFALSNSAQNVPGTVHCCGVVVGARFRSQWHWASRCLWCWPKSIFRRKRCWNIRWKHWWNCSDLQSATTKCRWSFAKRKRSNCSLKRTKTSNGFAPFSASPPSTVHCICSFCCTLSNSTFSKNQKFQIPTNSLIPKWWSKNQWKIHWKYTVIWILALYEYW